MGSLKSKTNAKGNQNHTVMRNGKSHESPFTHPVSDVSVKIQMTCIVRWWIRDCGDSLLEIPADIIQMIVDTFTYHFIFDIEHQAKRRFGDEYFRPFSEYYLQNEIPSRHKFKVLITGESGVGKTCIAERYINGIYEESDSRTIGVDFFSKTMEIDGTRQRLQLWDISGQERYRQLVHSYYAQCSAVIVVFDIGNSDYLEGIKLWSQKAMDYDASRSHLRILIGNKIDSCQRDDESIKEMQALAKKLGFIAYIETSAKTGENVENIFECVTLQLVYQIKRVLTPWLG